MQKPENPSNDTFDRALQVNLSLQAQGRYKASYHPEIMTRIKHEKNCTEIGEDVNNQMMRNLESIFL